jgi:hypothetical protein
MDFTLQTDIPDDTTSSHRDEKMSIDDVIDCMTIGKFHYLLIGLCGLAFMMISVV